MHTGKRDRPGLRARGFAIVGVFLAASAAVRAADPPAAGAARFGHLSIDDGLSQSIVERIVQDRHGFLWFATEDGLNRYDGYEFSVYRNRAGDPLSLSHNELETVYEDRRGFLWVGVFAGGLNRFDPATERVIRFAHDPADPDSLAAQTAQCVLEDRSGRLWVGTRGGGLDLLDRDSGRFSHHRIGGAGRPGDGSDDIRALCQDREGVLWVGTNGGGLARRDPESGRFVVDRHDPASVSSLADDRVAAILEDAAGRIWIGTAAGLDRFRPADGSFRHVDLSGGASAPTAVSVVALCEDHRGFVWIGTDRSGLACLDPDTGAVSWHRHDPLKRFSLSTDRIRSVREDRSRVLWVGTYGGGLNRLDTDRERFRRAAHDPADPHSLGGDIVWSFWEDPDGVLWVGTDSAGIGRLDPATGTWRHFRHDPADPASLSHDTVRALMRDRNGVLWAATDGGGLNRLDEATGRFTRFRHDPDDPTSLSGDRLRSVMQDRDGVLWLSMFGTGLDRFDPAEGRFTHFRSDPVDPSSLPSDFLRMVYEDGSGELWVGTQGGGLAGFDRGAGQFRRYTHDPEDPHSLPNDHVFAVVEGADGALWVATFGGGLARLDRASGTFTSYSVDDGLPTDSLYAMLPDERGRLWISTAKGLSRFDPQTGVFRNYDVHDGLQADEFNGGSAFRGADGEMFFGGINGFNAFYPGQIESNPVVPNVVLTELLLFNRPVRPGLRLGDRVTLRRSITTTDELRLSHRDDVLTLSFAALHFTAPEKNRYEYILEGFNDTWIPVQTGRRDATFTGLRPGEYTFRVRGSNSDGVWNERGASLRIVVEPPFWGTWWFRSASVLVLAALMWLGVRARLRAVEMGAELQAAHDAQMAIMPDTDPDVPGFELSAVCEPASEVGGDFFDHFWLEGTPRRLCVVVGDVSGKAMTAAMTAVMADGMVLSRMSRAADVGTTMTRLNRLLFHKTGSRTFVALCLLVLDPDTGELELADAGLCEPLLRTGEGADYVVPTGPRVPLGVWAETEYRSRTVRMAADDVLVVFSDGVPEARDSGGEPYGYEAPRRLLGSLDLEGLSAAEVRQRLMEDVGRFAGGSRASDDLTVVVLKRVGA